MKNALDFSYRVLTVLLMHTSVVYNYGNARLQECIIKRERRVSH